MRYDYFSKPSTFETAHALCDQEHLGVNNTFSHFDLILCSKNRQEKDYKVEKDANPAL